MDRLDLHGGLTVQESLAKVEAFCRARNHQACRQEYRVKIITGRGSHSEKNVARIRPAVRLLLIPLCAGWLMGTAAADSCLRVL